MGDARQIYHRRPEFIAERDRWYERLEQEGFNDAEVHDPGWPEPRTVWGLYRPALRVYDNCSIPELYDPDAELYYRTAAHWRWRRDAKWAKGPRGRLQRYAWERHAEGSTDSGIVEAVNTKTKMGPVTFWAVHKMLLRIRRQMTAKLMEDCRRDARRSKKTRD